MALINKVIEYKEILAELLFAYIWIGLGIALFIHKVREEE